MVVVCIGSLFPVVQARAQSGAPDAFNEIGIHKDHNYFSPEPYEHYDTVSGNVLLTFIDLTLPGNAGRQLQFQRTYNNLKGVPPKTRWMFGISGMVMRIVDKGYPADDFSFNDDLVLLKGWAPEFVTADGAVHSTIFTHRPDTDTGASKAATMRMVISAQFNKYDRLEKKLYMPDGTICEYEAAGVDPLGNQVYLLKNIWDAFDNQVELIRSPNATNPTTITVRQHLANTEVRDVVLTLDGDGRVELLTYGQSEWDYVYGYEEVGGLKDITNVIAPEGRQWTFSYVPSGDKPGDIEQITTPNGGRIHYEWQDVEITPVPNDPTFNFFRHLLRYRDSYDRNNVPLGHWTLDWGNETNQTEFSWNTIITTPSGPVYFHHGEQVPGGYLFEGGFGRLERTLGLPGFPLAESVTDSYTIVPLVRYSSTVWWGTAELSRRIIIRDSQTYRTDYEYDVDTSSATKFPWNMHRPTFIREDPTGFARVVERSYTKVPANADALSPGRYTLGLPSVEKITVSAETFQRSWNYDATGFLEWTKDFSKLPDVEGIKTTFTKDAFGNVATVTKANDKATTFTYSYGRVKDTTTGEYTISREIRPDGTVQSETQAGRTTLFEFDLLFRPTEVRPPGVPPTITDYDDALGIVTTTRGTSWTRTTVDGFGRPVGTIDSQNVQTTMVVDGEGRVRRRGYPFVGGPDVGTQITYDALGRVTRETNPDNSYRERTYSGNTVTIRDENERTTVQTFQTFGHPDDARLVTVRDAEQQSWYYAYDALNALRVVTTPDGLFRTWEYNSKHLLSQETHPESGATTFAYDGAGVRTQKTDANNVTTVYTYDLNDRVKTITAGAEVTTFEYEPGSDNRQSASVGSVSSVFLWDAAGRPAGRTDTIDGHTFNTRYEYDPDDNLTGVFYPSLGSATNRRRVGYQYDSGRRITRVFDMQVIGRDYATSFGYHPSGAVVAFNSGNAISNQFTYDPQRYWIRSASAGSWQLHYDSYDGVGNVGTIIDSRSGMNQVFGYDALDRLASAVGPYGSVAYLYDVHGNRQNANGSTYTYYPGQLRLWTQNADTFTYDGSGNLLTAPNRTYAYTPRNMIATATVSGVSTSYAYDADDWRVRKTTGTDTIYYFRGLNGELLTEWKNPGPNGSTRDYVYAGSRLIAAVGRPWTESFNDIYGTIVPNGPSVNVTFTTPGQRAWLTFEGTAGMRVSVWGRRQPGDWYLYYPLAILKPDGTTLASASYPYDAFIEPVTLPVDGVYTILVDPFGTYTGGAIVNLYTVTDVTGPITIDGPAVSASLTTPGQNARWTFNGTQGQRISVNGVRQSGWFLFEPLAVLKADGTPVASVGYPYDVLLEPFTLPATGTYTVLVDPSTSETGAVTVSVHEVVDVTGSITVNGSAVPVSLPTPGQQARLSMSATSGQQVTLQLTGNTIGMTTVSLLRPDGSTLTSGSSLSGSFNLTQQTLSTSGTYTVVVDPNGGNTGNITVTVTSP